MAGVPILLPVIQLFDNTGTPLIGGLIDVYAPGTLVRRDTYANQALSVVNPNPVVLDAAGRATIYLNSSLSYKFVIRDSAGVVLRTEDNVPGSVQIGLAVSASGLEWAGRLNAPAYAYHGLGVAAIDGIGLRLGGAIVPVGGGNTYGVALQTDLTPGVAASAIGVSVAPTLREQGAGTHPVFASLYVEPPTIVGGGAAVAEAASLMVAGQPSGGTLNRALHVVSGSVDLVGLQVAADGTVSYPTAQVFTHNAKVKDTVYLADADLLIVVRVLEAGTTSCTVRIQTGAANPPTTVYAGASVGTGAGYAREATLVAAVKKNDYWRVQESALVGSAPTYSIDAVPFGVTADGQV